MRFILLLISVSFLMSNLMFGEEGVPINLSEIQSGDNLFTPYSRIDSTVEYVVEVPTKDLKDKTTQRRSSKSYNNGFSFSDMAKNIEKKQDEAKTPTSEDLNTSFSSLAKKLKAKRNKLKKAEENDSSTSPTSKSSSQKKTTGNIKLN